MKSKNMLFLTVNSDGYAKGTMLKSRESRKNQESLVKRKEKEAVFNSHPNKVTFWAYDFDGNNFEVDGLRWDSNKKQYCLTDDSNMEFGSDLCEAIQDFALCYGMATRHRCHMAILGEERPAEYCLLVNWDSLFEEMRSMGILPYEYNPKDDSYNFHP